ncbi:hypothetical protein DL768_009632 [Monosporascus sp. mg162]|nr:hypothetical protein DL768_009632 [Monosporascus sp. mg162]
MAPIRVAIIGLSADAITDWAARVHLPYLLSPAGRARFHIIALCNSSVEAAKRSIKTFHLPSETRAYGSPDDLAADPDVQLVICSTRVDKHYETSLPSVKAGKDVFVEWPLAENAVKAVFDWVQHTLGDIQNIQSHLQLQRPTLKVQDSHTGRFIDTVESDVPDLIYVTGTLPGTEHIVKDATLHMRFRRAQAFLGEPALVWSIYGEKGEIRLTAALDTMLQVSSLMDVTIDIDDHENNEVQRVEWKWGAYPELHYLSRSYGPLYEAYYTGDVGKYADFGHAVKRHTQLDGILASWDASNAA